MRRLIFAIAILPWLFIACNSITFEEPQPSDGKVLSKFPLQLTGHYFDYDNEVDLFVNEDLVYSTHTSKDTISIKKMDKKERINGDTIYNPSTRNAYAIKRINDTLFTGYKFNDTLFNAMSDHNILKVDGDNYFLNHKIDEHSWIVNKLELKGQVLNIAHIETENEVKLMQRITNYQDDTTHSLHIKPTKDQFKKFVEQNGFMKGNSYLKMDSLSKI